MSYVPFKHKTEQTFRRKEAEVKLLCDRLFGPEHHQTHDRLHGKIFDNHGNWQYCNWTNSNHEDDARVKFRYAKDMTWFLLQAGHLVDPEEEKRWPYR